MIIHPNDDDFGDDPTSIGKIIVWTNQADEEYHTPYQIDDRIVKIEVKFPISQEGNTVFFRVVDQDDESPYETIDGIPDNYDQIGVVDVSIVDDPTVGLHSSIKE